MGSDELELGIVAVEGGLARGIGSDVAEITGVADLGGGGTVGHAMGVEVTTGRHASVGVVTELAITMDARLGDISHHRSHKREP